MMASSEEMMRSTSSKTAFCHDGTNKREKGGRKDDNDKKEKVSFICFLIASICFYFVAVVNFMDDQTNTAVTYFCLGSAFLCLSTTHLNKNGKGRS